MSITLLAAAPPQPQFVDPANRFALDHATRNELRSLQPQWGYGAFSEFIFYRTYSRYGEAWADVIIRVIEGVFSIRKQHYADRGLPWDEAVMQARGREMAYSAFNGEWGPPGRGYWAMGTDLVYRQGSMALNNCGFVDVKVLSRDAHWAMDALMLGVGVGFSAYHDVVTDLGLPRTPDGERAAKVRIEAPEDDWIKGYPTQSYQQAKEAWDAAELTYVIPDSREGWADSVKLLLESYETAGPTIRFDYSRLRPRGAKIMGFGGEASGYWPLKKLHMQLRVILTHAATHPEEWRPSRLITDVINLIGCCIVAGNVRRSATIALGHPDDAEFAALKHYADVDAQGRVTPTRYWYRRRFGWMCLPGETWVTTSDGPRQIVDLIETPYVAIVDGKPYHSSGFFSAGEKPVVEIWAQGQQLRSSPDHKLMTDQGWKRAGEIQPGDRLRLHTHPTLSWGGPGTEDEGYRLGFLLGDGWFRSDGRAVLCSHPGDTGALAVRERISRSLDGARWVVPPSHTEARLSSAGLGRLAAKFGMTPGHKTATPQIERASSEFAKGFLRGLFDADGSVEILGKTRAARGVRLASSDPEVIVMVQRMLARLGIMARTCTCKSTSGWRKKQAYALTIRGRDAQLFGEVIGFTHASKAQSLAEQGDTRITERGYVTVETMSANGHELMYDCMVEEVHAYDANGFYVSNSNNSYVLSEREHFERLVPLISEGIKRNGEPGFLNLKAVRAFGRLGDRAGITLANGSVLRRDEAIGINPCGEVPLESYELCCLAEWYPTRCLDAQGQIDFARAMRAAEHAAFYTQSVQLLPTHRPESNAVIARNRRTGVSLAGAAALREMTTMTEAIRLMEHGYDAIRAENKRLAIESQVPEAIRVTAEKPSGTTSLMMGVPAGAHWPTSGYMIRRARVDNGRLRLRNVLDAAGVPHEPDLISANTEVYAFPVKTPGAEQMRPVHEVSMWEQADLAVVLSQHFVDNATSITVTFDPLTRQEKEQQSEDLLRQYADAQGQLRLLDGLLATASERDAALTGAREKMVAQQERLLADFAALQRRHPEGDEVERLVASYVGKLKSMAMLPRMDHGYAQAPEEEIDEATYQQLVGEIGDLDWARFRDDGMDEFYCASCETL